MSAYHSVSKAVALRDAGFTRTARRRIFVHEVIVRDVSDLEREWDVRER